MAKALAFILSGGGCLLGLFSATYFTLAASLLPFAATLLGVILLLLWSRPYTKQIVIFLLFVLAGQLYVSLWTKKVAADIPFGETVAASGSVASCRESYRLPKCIVDVYTPFAARVSFISGKDISPGATVNLSATVRPLSAANAFLLGDGVAAVLDQTQLIDVSMPRFSIRLWLHRAKVASEALLARALTEPASSLATGLLFGSRQQFSDDFVDALKRTNTLHIVAVSGFNITILVEFIRRLLSAFPRKIVFLLASLSIVLFVLMIGAPASAIRAGIMGLVLILGNIIGRKPFAPSMIIFTALIMALPNPFMLRYDLGFQLSFLAFAGLVGLAPGIEKKIVLVPSPVRSLLAATLGASAATAPLLIFLNNTISLIGPLANLLILPLIPLIMLMGALTLGISFASLALARLIGMLLYLPSLWVVRIVESAAALPIASVHWLVGGAVIFVTGALIYLSQRRRSVAR